MRINEDSTFVCGILQVSLSVFTVLLGSLWSHRIEMYFVDKRNGSFHKVEFEPILLGSHLNLILINIPSKYCELDNACLTVENLPIRKKIQGLTCLLKTNSV